MQSLSSKENFFIGVSLANSSNYGSSICVLDRNCNIILLDKFYFANDIENTGYDIMPDDKGIFGSGFGIKYVQKTGLPSIKIVDETNKIGELVNGQLIPNHDTYKVAAETNAVDSLISKYGSSKDKIKIYLAAHHGCNNAIDAMEKLNPINRSDVYSIYTMRPKPEYKKNFPLHKSYYISLSNTKKMTVGNSSEGIHCYMKKNKATCENYMYNSELNLLIKQDGERKIANDCSKENN